MIYSVTLWRIFIIFGLDGLNIITKPLNIIILYAKYFIYTTCCNERQLVLEVYKKKLYQLFKILKDIALSNNELTEFSKIGNHMKYNLIIKNRYISINIPTLTYQE